MKQTAVLILYEGLYVLGGFPKDSVHMLKKNKDSPEKNWISISMHALIEITEIIYTDHL